MRVRVVDINDSRWTNALSQLPHDVYHRSAYIALDAARLQARPEAFLAEADDRRFCVPYLVRSCDSAAMDGGPAIFDAVSPYGYAGILLNEAGRDPGFAAAALAA